MGIYFLHFELQITPYNSNVTYYLILVNNKTQAVSKETSFRKNKKTNLESYKVTKIQKHSVMSHNSNGKNLKMTKVTSYTAKKQNITSKLTRLTAKTKTT